MLSKPSAPPLVLSYNMGLLLMQNIEDLEVLAQGRFQCETVITSSDGATVYRLPECTKPNDAHEQVILMPDGTAALYIANNVNGRLEPYEFVRNLGMANKLRFCAHYR